MEYQSCLNKQEKLKTLFLNCTTQEKRYEKMIELGHHLPPYPENFKTPEYLVKGCQSLLYLKSYFKKNCINFIAFSEALISAGLAAMLLSIYNEEKPEVLIKCPPIVLKELKILNYLSPSRSNGLRSLYLKMQKEALNHLCQKSL